MSRPDLRRAALVAALLMLTACAGADDAPRPPDATAGTYATMPPSRDGIGKVYMGREISRVMGHLGAGWLERPLREQEERTDLVIRNLPLAPGDVAVDLGAGTGYFTLPMAERVGPAGRVLAVDIQPEMLAIIEGRLEDDNVTNVETVLATESDPSLPPATVDLVLLVDAYHEFAYPAEVMRAVFASLKPGGRVVLVEYRGEDPAVPIKALHKMTEAQAIRELAAAGLAHVETLDFLPQQHFLIFERPAG